MKWIHKVGLAAELNGYLLVARKRGTDTFILPGGKPEGEENDLQTLAREIREELDCGVEQPILRGIFSDVAAGEVKAAVVVRLYSGNLIGTPKPCSEIEELVWVNIRKPTIKLAPSISNQILPFLNKRNINKSKRNQVDDLL